MATSISKTLRSNSLFKHYIIEHQQEQREHNNNNKMNGQTEQPAVNTTVLGLYQSDSGYGSWTEDSRDPTTIQFIEPKIGVCSADGEESRGRRVIKCDIIDRRRRTLDAIMHPNTAKSGGGGWLNCFTCSSDLKTWRARYMCLLAWLWAACLGPFAGWLAACNHVNGASQFELNTMITLMFFLLSMLLTVKPESRWAARFWVFMGILWTAFSWLKYSQRAWDEDLDNWFDICLVKSVLLGLTGILPLVLTDPATLWLAELLIH